MAEDKKQVVKLYEETGGIEGNSSSFRTAMKELEITKKKALAEGIEECLANVRALADQEDENVEEILNALWRASEYAYDLVKPENL